MEKIQKFSYSSSPTRIQNLSEFIQIIDSQSEKRVLCVKVSGVQNTMRKTWKVINSVIRPSSHSPDIPTKLDVDGVLIEGPCEIKNSLASCFASVGEKTVKALGGSAISLTQDQHLKFMGPPCLISIVIELV